MCFWQWLKSNTNPDSAVLNNLQHNWSLGRCFVFRVATSRAEIMKEATFEATNSKLFMNKLWSWWGFPDSLSTLLQIYRLKSRKSNLFRIEFRQQKVSVEFMSLFCKTPRGEVRTRCQRRDWHFTRMRLSPLIDAHEVASCSSFLRFFVESHASCRILPWEPKTFIFRGYNPYTGGFKPSFFMVLGSKGIKSYSTISYLWYTKFKIKIFLHHFFFFNK